MLTSATPIALEAAFTALAGSLKSGFMPFNSVVLAVLAGSKLPEVATKSNSRFIKTLKLLLNTSIP